MNLNEKIDTLMQHKNLQGSSVEELMEALSQSGEKELVQMCDYAIDKYGIQLPFWILLISYRLATLQSTGDNEIFNKAANMIETYGGPDYDAIASEYRAISEKH